MKMNLYDFAIVGGDLRQVYMANELTNLGFSVVVYGLDSGYLSEMCTIANSLNDAISHAKNIVGPIPLTKDKKTVVCQIKKEDLTLENLKNLLNENHVFFAGCISEDMIHFCESNKIAVYDFMENEELAVFNTIATAEGTIAEAILRHPSNLHQSNCLVLGYGKCAKTLAQKLDGLSANITICARSENARAVAKAFGYKIISFSELNQHISQYEYIFNTVPSVVLDYEALSNINQDSIILDIASSPGGVDYENAEKRGIHAYLCLGIPGKYAPKASAKAIVETLLSNL